MGEKTTPTSARLSESERDRLSAYAQKHDVSKADALRQLVNTGLELSGESDASIEASPDIQRLLELQEQSEQLAEQVSQRITKQRNHVAEQLANHADLSNLDREALEAFAEQPYKLLPKDEDAYYVITPRFTPFTVGHLLEQDDAWNVFVINKYVAWIEDVPEIIRDKIDIGDRFPDVTVRDDMVETDDEETRDELWDALDGQDGGLYQRKGETDIQIKSGKEFDVLAGLIEQGSLPFAPREIDPDDKRGEPDGVSLRPYQERAWEQFETYGQVGVYWPPGLGKTFFGLYAGERVSGKKLVVVPSSTLEQQWEDRIKKYIDSRRRRREWEVRTYQYLTTNSNINDYTGHNSPALTIFDECHTLPANTFSKLATIDTDYRIGLSATPYREDERTDYIFALTGVPVGIDWAELQEYGEFDYPEVSVYLYRTERMKRDDLETLTTKSSGKTLVYCDGIDAGKRLSSSLDLPFVHGETPKSDRIETVENNRVTIVSRVADEGLSIDDLDQVIEYQFHGSSRRQELQRAGRVMHSEGIGRHIVQMTDAEYEKFSERLYSLEEKGMDIRIERRK